MSESANQWRESSLSLSFSSSPSPSWNLSTQIQSQSQTINKKNVDVHSDYSEMKVMLLIPQLQVGVSWSWSSCWCRNCNNSYGYCCYCRCWYYWRLDRLVPPWAFAKQQRGHGQANNKTNEEAVTRFKWIHFNSNIVLTPVVELRLTIKDVYRWVICLQIRYPTASGTDWLMSLVFNQTFWWHQTQDQRSMRRCTSFTTSMTSLWWTPTRATL